jgi:excisionase family DNA binding protein
MEKSGSERDVLSQEFLNVRETAQLLHVAVSTVRKWSTAGLLPSYRLGPRRDRRFLKSDVLRFLRESPGRER